LIGQVNPCPSQCHVKDNMSEVSDLIIVLLGVHFFFVSHVSMMKQEAMVQKKFYSFLAVTHSNCLPSKPSQTARLGTLL